MDGSQLLLNIYQSWIKRIQKPLDAQMQDFNTDYAACQNMVFNAAGLAIKSGGGSPDYLTANTINYMIAGAIYTKAAVADNVVTAGTPTMIASQSMAILVQINAAGTISTKNSAVVVANPVIPSPDALNAAIGVIWVTTAVGFVGTWTPGAGGTNLDAANTTVVYRDFVGTIIPPVLTALPHRPTRQDASGITCATYDPFAPASSGAVDEDNLPQLY